MKEQELLKEISKFLKKKGWNVFLIGFKGISKTDLRKKYNLIIEFVGSKSLTEKK
jgi:hypothetical protein